MEDIELYKTLREIKRIIELNDSGQEPVAQSSSQENEKDDENSSVLKDVVSISNIISPAAAAYIFKNGNTTVKWLTTENNPQKLTLGSFNNQAFKNDTNEFKYAQVIYLFLKDLFSSEKKDKFSWSGKPQTVIQTLAKQVCGNSSVSCEEFYEHLRKEAIQKGISQSIDNSSNGEKLISYLCNLAGISIKSKESKDINYFVTYNAAADDFAVKNYGKYFAWVSLCKLLQSYDIPHNSRFKYVFYDYMKDKEGNIQNIYESYGINEGEWNNKYYPEFVNMIKKANSNAVQNCRKYWFSRETDPNLADLLDPIEFGKGDSDIKQYPALINMILTNPWRKSSGGLTAAFKGNENTITENALDSNRKPICALWYAPGRDVSREKNKQEDLKSAYATKKSKRIRHKFIV